MSRFCHAFRATLLIGLLAGCNDVTAPEVVDAGSLPIPEQPPTTGVTVSQVATLEFYGNPSAIEIPATATVGQTAEARITTYSGGCISDDTISIVRTDDRADVVPYQKVYTPRANEACTADLRITRRVVALVFRKAGEVTVTVTGRSRPSGELLRITRTVRVN